MVYADDDGLEHEVHLSSQMQVMLLEQQEDITQRLGKVRRLGLGRS